MGSSQRYREAKRVTIIGALINALLGVVKIVGGILFHSHALMADGVHSFADLFTDVMVIFASKYGSQAADDSHPYGHGRIETAATMLLSLFLILAGAGIAWDAMYSIIAQTHDKPEFSALPIAIFSIVANEGLYQYTRQVGKRIRSDLIITNAWHHRSDAASSLVVAAGLVGSFLGYDYLDAFAAIIVALMIVKMGWNYVWSSVKELVDTAVDDATLQKIESVICNVDGVIKMHQLRSRMMAGDILIDVHILVAPMISVSEGHYIAQHVHKSLMEKIDRVKDVTVHVDPEDDQISAPSYHLPNRQRLEKILLEPWKTKFSCIQTVILHYLDGQLLIDVIVQMEGKGIQSLQECLAQDAAKYDMIGRVRILQE